MLIDQNAFIQTFAEAVAAKEGFYDRKKIQTIPQRLNNPCCLPHWKNEQGRPFEEINGYVNFPTVERGWAAARAQCRINILKRKLTFREFFCGKPGVYDGFAKKGEKNDPMGYSRFVLNTLSRKLGIEDATIDTPIHTLFQGKAA